MSRNNQNIILYGQGLLNRYNTPANKAVIEGIRTSGFTTVILFAVHVSDDGTLYYSNYPMVVDGNFTGQYSYLPAAVEALKTGGSVKQILFSIGGACVGDFAHLKNLWSTTQGQNVVLKNFGALAAALPIDGFDFDLEEFPLSGYADTVVGMSIKFHDLFGARISYAPYNSPDFWVSCLQQAYKEKKNEVQVVDWFNLQCYSGGAGNDPSVWVNDIKNAGDTGVSDAAAFVVPGYSSVAPPNCSPDPAVGVFCPTDAQNQFYDLAKNTDPGITGGFIWNFGQIVSCQGFSTCTGAITPRAYAQAIINGLNGAKAGV